MARTRAPRTPSTRERRRDAERKAPKALDADALVAKRDAAVAEHQKLVQTKNVLTDQLAQIDAAIEQNRGKVTLLMEQLQELGVQEAAPAEVVKPEE